jgi:hypothetical protein
LEALLSPKQTIQIDQDPPLEIDQQETQHEHFIQQTNEQNSVQVPQINQQNKSPDVTQPFQVSDKQDLAYSSAIAKKKRIDRKGFMLLLMVLLLLLGATSYTIAGFLGAPLPGFVAIQPPVTTIAINSSIPYAGVDITILNAQQSQGFITDPNSSSNGMVRLKLSEHNTTSVKVSWSYENIARLILPDKSIVSPTYTNARVDIAPGAFQKSVVDFAVPINDHISQLTLLLGTAKEAQMLIPLTQNANLSKYQPKTISLSGQMQYFGLNWTLTSATLSLSMNGQQATRGMRYIAIMLKVDNTLSQVAITGSPYDFIRLKFGSVTSLPQYTTLPVAFNEGAAGVTGTVSFLVAQNSKEFTLLLEPQKEDSGDTASTDFLIA